MPDYLKQELYENTYTDAYHFSFGRNWQHFLRSLNVEKIHEAEKSLVHFLGGMTNIKGKTFIDIGCGSGLFSLAAVRLGAEKVASIDVDDFSLACTTQLRNQENNPPHWEIHKMSALDSALYYLGTFDIVYSWGVLHHTGDMYEAMKNVSRLMKPTGMLYIAIYNNNQRMLEGTSLFWLKIKGAYNNSPWIIKQFLQISYTAYYILGLLLHGKNPIQYILNYTSLRGMSFMTDIKDWVGGYPYEYASPEKVISYATSLGLTCIKTHKARSIGCNEFLFIKQI